MNTPTNANNIQFTRALYAWKKDLDCMVAGALAGVDPQVHTILPMPNTRTEEGRALLAQYLADPDVLCLETGGSGQVDLNNFDHHDPEGPDKSATLQVWEALGSPEELRALVIFVDTLDRIGPEALGSKRPNVSFTNVVAGLLLIASDTKMPVEELVTRFNEVVKSVLEYGKDPYGEFTSEGIDQQRFDAYVAKKRLEDQLAEEAAKNIYHVELPSGGVIAVLESNYRGATGACYNSGTNVHYCLCIADDFMHTGKRKVTAGVNTKVHPDGSVTDFLNAINAIEEGAGGPPNGKVGGSKLGTELGMRSGANPDLPDYDGLIRLAVKNMK